MLTEPVVAEWRTQYNAVVEVLSKDVLSFDAASVQDELKTLHRLVRVLQCFDGFTEQVGQFAQLRCRFENTCKAVTRTNKRVTCYKEKEKKVERYLHDVDSAVMKERLDGEKQWGL